MIKKKTTFNEFTDLFKEKNAKPFNFYHHCDALHSEVPRLVNLFMTLTYSHRIKHLNLNVANKYRIVTLIRER